MKVKGPYVTLGAVAALGVTLLLVNVANESGSAPAGKPAASAPAAPQSSAPAPPTTAEPPPEAFPAKADYVGKIPTGSGVMTVEITVEGNKAIAYACDGKAVESWLRGNALNGVVSLDNKDKTSHLDGHLAGGHVDGTLKIGREQLSFNAAPAEPPAGLYVYLEGNARTSWIIDQDNGVTGVQRQQDGSKSPAPTLSTDGTAVVNGQTITATRVEGNSDVI